MKKHFILLAAFSLLFSLGLTSCMDLYDSNEVQTSFTVTFDGNGGSYVDAGGNAITSYTQNFYWGEEKALSPNLFEKSGYEFIGWAETTDATTATYSNGDNFKTTTDRVFYAVWSSVSFTITFDGNGGKTVGGDDKYTQTFAKGEIKELLANNFVFSGKGFAGWSTNKDATKGDYKDKNSMSFDKDTTLYAVWTSLFYVTFNTNPPEISPGEYASVSGSMDKQEFTEGVEQALNASLYTCSGFDFSGWATTPVAKDASHNYNNGAKITLNSSDITLYAVWVTGSRDLYVSNSGADNNTGTQSSPFGSLNAAITRINTVASVNDDWNVYILDNVTNSNTEITAFKAKSLTITKVTSDASLQGGAEGGSVLSIRAPADITITNVTIKGGTGRKAEQNPEDTYGGGIYVNNTNAKLALGTGSVVTGNTAKYGAGVYVESGTITLSSCEISANNGAIDGGGAYVKGGKLVMSGSSVIKGHSATNGGGVYVAGGNFTFNDGKIGAIGSGNENTASSGGGIYIANGTVDMNGGYIENNITNGTQTDAGGGGIYNKSTFNMNAGFIIKNNATASNLGGGVFNAGTMIMKNTAVIGDSNAPSQATSSNYSNTASRGGGVYNKGILRMDSSLTTGGIYYNMADEGGGIFIETGENSTTIESGYLLYNVGLGRNPKHGIAGDTAHLSNTAPSDHIQND